MNELEDIKLKAMLQELELESPKENFSFRVMNKIFQEENALEKIKSERILGKGFWTITILFILLLASIFVISNFGIAPESQLSNLFPKLNDGLSNGYSSFFTKLGTAPLSVAGIFFAASILLFIERFINSNAKVFS